MGHSPYLCEFDFTYSSGSRLICLWEVDYSLILLVLVGERALNHRHEKILTVQGGEQPLNYRYGTILAVKGVEHPLTPSTSKNPNPSLSSLTKKSLLVLIIRLDERKLLLKMLLVSFFHFFFRVNELHRVAADECACRDVFVDEGCR